MPIPPLALATDGVTLSNGFDGFIDFTLTDTTGAETTLTGFHFDIGAFRPNAATDWELEVLAGGDLTAGSLATGTATASEGPMQDDESIDLTVLADNTLDANGTVTFRLNFTGGGGDSGSPADGHHLFLDNVGVTGLRLALPGDYNNDGFVDAADYTVWRDGGSPDSTQAGYLLWRANFGATQSAPTAAQNTAAPEPGAMAMLVLIGCGKMARRSSRFANPVRI